MVALYNQAATGAKAGTFHEKATLLAVFFTLIVLGQLHDAQRVLNTWKNCLNVETDHPLIATTRF